MLDQALGFFQYHFRDLHVARGRFVEGGGNHFALHRAGHFRHFFRALVDQEHDQRDVRMVGRDGVGDVLHHHCLAGLGAGHQQAALAFADGGDHVDDAAGDVFLAANVALELQRLIRVQRGEVFEQDLVLGAFRGFAVDRVDLDQGEVAFAVLGRSDFTVDGVAGVQVEAADLRRRDVNVVRSCQIGAVRRAQESEAVLQHFQGAVAKNGFALFRLVLEQGEDEVLLAHAAGTLDFMGNGHLHNFGDGQVFKVG
ncbi:hypothetical protein GALL_394490 [mine drainage metagenome]|uniref:NAD-specific glutamate dehydrogenase n=1 Tax=mine drainage metagenome TaxID=410659 RepID=A0A1J5Q5A4_9ZZZZ